MTVSWDEVSRILRERHRIGLFDVPGGWGWSCSCGVTKYPGTGYPTQRVAASRSDRHLRAERRKIEKELANASP